MSRRRLNNTMIVKHLDAAIDAFLVWTPVKYCDMLQHSHSMKDGLETRQSQRTLVLSSIITWEVCWSQLKMTVHGYFGWLKWC